MTSTANKIRALPWKGNATDIVTGSSLDPKLDNSLLAQAQRLIEAEYDNAAAWEGEKALQKLCFGEDLSDEDRSQWEKDQGR